MTSVLRTAARTALLPMVAAIALLGATSSAEAYYPSPPVVVYPAPPVIYYPSPPVWPRPPVFVPPPPIYVPMPPVVIFPPAPRPYYGY